MSSPLYISSYSEDKKFYAIFEENKTNAWLYLCMTKGDAQMASDIIGDVFVCNTVDLIEHSDLERYKPGIPPITNGFGHPEAVCKDIDTVDWELKWLKEKAVLLTKAGKPWALIPYGEKRGMCKAIKKSGPWGNDWVEQKYKKFC